MRPIVEGMGLDWASQFAKLNANQARWGLDTKRRAAVAGRLKDGYPVADLLTAIDGCKASAWHQGRNDRQRPFNDLGLICRDSAHVEQFIELARGQQAPAWRSKRLTSVWWPNIVCWGDGRSGSCRWGGMRHVEQPSCSGRWRLDDSRAIRSGICCRHPRYPHKSPRRLNPARHSRPWRSTGPMSGGCGCSGCMKPSGAAHPLRWLSVVKIVRHANVNALSSLSETPWPS
jgi:hypothetical protein